MSLTPMKSITTRKSTTLTTTVAQNATRKLDFTVL